MHMRKRNLPAIAAAIITIGCITISAQTVTTLHSFNGGDGQSPDAALVQGSDGNFYGTTAVGGANSQGMAFKINAAGTLTTLHSFNGFPTDGALPVAGLLPTNLSIFFGTTASGGMFFQGTVFGMTPSGVTVMLHSFNSFLGEGAVPTAGLVRGSDGNFYGTTVSGGAHYQGTLFRITPAGALTVLHSFSGAPSEGAVPFAGLVQGTDGNFYGTTALGGANSEGTVFKLSSSSSSNN